MLLIQVLGILAMIVISTANLVGSSAIGCRLNSLHDDRIVPLRQIRNVDQTYPIDGPPLLRNLALGEITQDDAALDEARAVAAHGDLEGVRHYLDDDPRIAVVRDALNPLADYQEQEADRLTAQGFGLSRLIMAGTAGGSALMIALTLALVLTYGQRQRRYLHAAAGIAARVAAGDLRATVEATFRDEAGEVGHELNTMIERLRRVVGDVSTTTRHVAAGFNVQFTRAVAS